MSFFALTSSVLIKKTLANAILYSISPNDTLKSVDKLAVIDKTADRDSSVTEKATKSSFPAPSDKDNKKVVWLVTPVIATQTIKGNIKNSKSSNPRNFTAKAINPSDLRSGTIIQALADHLFDQALADSIIEKNKKTDDLNSNQESTQELKSLGATVISISKESDNEGVILVRFRFDKLMSAMKAVSAIRIRDTRKAESRAKSDAFGAIIWCRCRSLHRLLS